MANIAPTVKWSSKIRIICKVRRRILAYKENSLGGCSGSSSRAQLIRSWERERESGIVGWNIQKQLIRRQVRERERWMKSEGSSQVIWNPEANIMLMSTIQWFWMNEPPVFNYVRFVLFKADPLILFFPITEACNNSFSWKQWHWG